MGRGGLYFLPKILTVNAERYQSVLENHLLRFMKLHGCTHFLQDGAPCHASKQIKTFLAEQYFEVVDWPGSSPGLNPTWKLLDSNEEHAEEKEHLFCLLVNHGHQGAVDHGAQQGLSQEAECAN